MKEHGLYLVASEEHAQGKSIINVVKEAIAGGIDMVQMREKNKTRDELIELGEKIKALCREKGVLFIVNDDPLLARELGSDGVHLGQEDIKKCGIDKTRKILGKNKIIGISTHSPEEFKGALREDCDYIAFGPIFPTKTKNYFIGTNDIEGLAALAVKPVVFIGGITRDNIDTVLKKGARHIAVIRALTQARDVKKETEFLKKRISRFCGRKDDCKN